MAIDWYNPTEAQKNKLWSMFVDWWKEDEIAKESWRLYRDQINPPHTVDVFESFKEPIIEECTEGCTTYSKHCEYNHC